MTLPSFDVFMPSTAQDALIFLSEHPETTKIIAGGTDLIPSLKQRLFEPSYVLDIKSVPEWNGIQEDADGGLRIGALTTISEIAGSSVIASNFQVLQMAAASVAGPSLRNVGTIGGNICLDTRCYWYNQSYFWRQSCGFCIKKDGTICHVAPSSKKCWAVYSGDTAAALLTLSASIRLISFGKERVLPVSEFFVNEGRIRNKLAPDEILSEILIPPSARGYSGCYEKFRLRGSVDYPLAGVAAIAKKSNGQIEDLRIALTAVNPLPILVEAKTDKNGTDARSAVDLIQTMQKLTMKTAKPLKTSASTMDYRRHMVGVMTKRVLQKLGL